MSIRSEEAKGVFDEFLMICFSKGKGGCSLVPRVSHNFSRPPRSLRGGVIKDPGNEAEGVIVYVFANLVSVVTKRYSDNSLSESNSGATASCHGEHS